MEHSTNVQMAARKTEAWDSDAIAKDLSGGLHHILCFFDSRTPERAVAFVYVAFSPSEKFLILP